MYVTSVKILRLFTCLRRRKSVKIFPKNNKSSFIMTPIKWDVKKILRASFGKLTPYTDSTLVPYYAHLMLWRKFSSVQKRFIRVSNSFSLCSQIVFIFRLLCYAFIMLIQACPCLRRRHVAREIWPLFGVFGRRKKPRAASTFENTSHSPYGAEKSLSYRY